MDTVPGPSAAPADDAPKAEPVARAPGPSDALFATLYSELHRLARREAARAGSGASVSATTLLHEAYLDMVQRDALAFPDRARFLAYAARAMRTLSDIGTALDELAEVEPELANIVDLKFFCGFAVAEIAAMRGVSERTVQRQREKARLLLFRALAQRR